MSLYKKLAGQVVIYGLGTVVPRFLNYSILTVYYTRLFDVGEYGKMTELYAYIMFLNVILTYGLETAFFRLTTGKRSKEFIGNILTSITISSFIFPIGVMIFADKIAGAMKYGEHVEYIIMLAWIVALDAFSAILFAKLRKEEKSKKFAYLKFINVTITIIAVLFFYEIIPIVFRENKQVYFIGEMNTIKFVLVSNLIASASILLFLIGEIKNIGYKLSTKILKEIYRFSLPLLVVGLVGVVNEALDRVIMRHLIEDEFLADYNLGIYGANYRIAMLLAIFIQMYRLAIEPFFFNYFEKKDAKIIFSNLMRIYVICACILIILIQINIDLFKHFIASKFHEGLHIVPIILFSYLLYGILFNLSVWYKIKKITHYGALITVTGAVITIVINVLFVKKYFYVASAYGHLASYFAMVIISFLWGRKYYKIDYKILRIIEYIMITIALIIIINMLKIENIIVRAVISIVAVSIYVIYLQKREKINVIRNMLKA